MKRLPITAALGAAAALLLTSIQKFDETLVAASVGVSCP